MIDAPVATVAAALRHTPTAEDGLACLGIRGRAVPPVRELLSPGDELDFTVPLAGVRIPLRTRIVRADAECLASVLVRGVLPELRHDAVLTDVDGATMLTDAVHWRSPAGSLGRIADRAFVRRWVSDVVTQRVEHVRQVAQEWAQRRAVVGAAVVHDGRLLVQQRRFPVEVAGQWELPGGRVEPGERELDAVIRECKEELDVQVVPGSRVGTDVPLDNGMVLRVYAANLVDDSARPRAIEHHSVRWVTPSELVGLDWLDTDRMLVHSLRELLR